MFVTLGGVFTGHVYKTTHALSTHDWSDFTPSVGGQPFDIAHKTIIIDPLVPNRVFVGTELGLWQSTDSGMTWPTHVGLANGLPYAPIFDLQTNERTNQLVAFTHGRSAYQTDLQRCTGDCNGSGVVTGTEITKMVNIQGGTQDLCMCPVGDSNHDGRITGTEVTQAVNNQAMGCPS